MTCYHLRSFFYRGIVAHMDVYQVPGTDPDLPVVPYPVIETVRVSSPRGILHSCVEDDQTVDSPARRPDVLARVGEHYITMSACRTDMLVGATFTQAARISYQSGFTIVLPFTVIHGYARPSNE